MTQSTIATMADYADAMITARRAKNWLFVLLLLMMLAQLAIFGVARFTDLLPRVIDKSASPAESVAVDAMRALTAVIDFAGMALIIVLALVLLLIVVIMLVGRTIGVSRLTSAFIWTVLLAVLLFPWQAFLASRSTVEPQTITVQAMLAAPTGTETPAALPSTNPSATTLPAPSIAAPAAPAQPAPLAVRPAAARESLFRIPGVLYTWEELSSDARFSGDTRHVILKWARFAGFPLLAVLLLLVVQVNSSRGLRLALGEADVTTADTAA